jgi:nitroreductase
MCFSETMEKRRSVRAFQKKAVPRKVLQNILQVALRAPSWGNTQPWKITVVGGETLQAMIEEFVKKASAGEPPHPDMEIPGEWPEPLARRYKENGKRLFEVLDIGREDKEKRKAHMMNMFRFFGAPQVIYLHIDRKLGPYSIFDAGLLAQNIALLAAEKELGTCFLAVSVWFADVVRRHTGIAESDKMVIGMAIGYPDGHAPINRFRSEREPLETFVRWVG